MRAVHIGILVIGAVGLAFSAYIWKDATAKPRPLRRVTTWPPRH